MRCHQGIIIAFHTLLCNFTAADVSFRGPFFASIICLFDIWEHFLIMTRNFLLRQHSLSFYHYIFNEEWPLENLEHHAILLSVFMATWPYRTKLNWIPSNSFFFSGLKHLLFGWCISSFSVISFLKRVCVFFNHSWHTILVSCCTHQSVGRP